MQKKVQWLPLTLNLLLALGGGMLSFLFSSVSPAVYAHYSPPLAPPAVSIPIIWILFYLWMGYYAYRAFELKSAYRGIARFLYYTQLLLSFLWMIIFFNTEAFLLTALWGVVLLGFTVLMICAYAKIDRKIALLQIPYALWLLFLSYIAAAIHFL